MRYALAAAPFVAAVMAQDTSASYTLVPEISGSVTVTSTYYYSNPATKFLTMTNSDGVVTGLPGASTAGQAPAVTSQPEVATIPAGISGTTVIYYNASTGLTSFTVDGSKKTTEVLGGVNVPTVAGSSAGASGPMQTGSSGSGSGSGSGRGGNGGNGGSGSGSSASASESASGTGSSASSTSSGAAVSNMKAASAGVLGLGAFFAALL